MTAQRPARSSPRVREDETAAEVGDEQVAAEWAEPARCERHAPRLVESLRRRDASDEPALQVELVDDSARRSVVPVHGRLSRVRDEYVPAERRDAERRISGAELLVDEAACRAHSTPMGVEDEHAPVVEVRRIHSPTLQREPAEE